MDGRPESKEEMQLRAQEALLRIERAERRKASTSPMASPTPPATSRAPLSFWGVVWAIVVGLLLFYALGRVAGL